MANGKAGAPAGNNNGKGNAKTKVWTDAIRKAVLEKEKGKPQRIMRLAHALLDKAESGDVTALKEFGDRIEGKPVQAIEGTGPDGSFVGKLTIEYVKPENPAPR